MARSVVSVVNVPNKETLFYLAVDDTPITNTSSFDIADALAIYDRRLRMYQTTNHMDTNNIKKIRLSLKCRGVEDGAKAVTLKEVVVTLEG